MIMNKKVSLRDEMGFINEEALEKVVRDFLSTKRRTKSYEVKTLNEEILLEQSYLATFDDEMLLALKALKQKYGVDEFVNHLNEVVDDIYDYLNISGSLTILDIDLETPHYQYCFTIHEVHENGLNSRNAHVELSDYEYGKLLKLCLDDKNMNINALRYADKALYEIVTREIDAHYCDEDFYQNYSPAPHTVTMDEVNNDAKIIIKEHPELLDDGYRCYIFS